MLKRSCWHKLASILSTTTSKSTYNRFAVPATPNYIAQDLVQSFNGVQTLSQNALYVNIFTNTVMEGNQLQVVKGRSPTVIESQQSLAYPSWRMAILLSLVYFKPPPHSVLLSVLQCKNCVNIVDRPLMTPCSHLLCCTCAVEGMRQKTLCSACRSSHSAPSISAGVVVYEVVGSLQSHCASCGPTLELQRMKEYLNSIVRR